VTIPPEEFWRESIPSDEQKLLPRRPSLDAFRPLKIHSEFHRLVLEWESALIEYCWLSTDKDGAKAVEDGYVALQQRKKELYEWVRDNTAIPSPLYTIHTKF
jgi:hypothetical protein